MSLEIIPFVLGPLENNTYLIIDRATGSAAIIDPAIDSETVVSAAAAQNLAIGQVWLTHAHFDHFAGTKAALKALGQEIPTGIHPADLDLWRGKGGAVHFGFDVDLGPEPSVFFSDGQKLFLGESEFEVRHIPGHSRGHVVFYCQEAAVVLCGDVIFKRSIGRTDLPGGSFETLIEGIRRKILTLPDETSLLPGHGPATTVGEERRNNPFLKNYP